MRGRFVILFLVAWFAGFAAYLFWPESEISRPPGVLVPEEPHQRLTPNGLSWHQGEYVITQLAEFQVRARVLHIERYSSGRESDLSPLDLALGWGPMSDSNVLDHMSISQGHRWYEWSAQRLPIPRNLITANSSNMHMIPSGKGVEETLESLQKGNIILLTGSLVAVKASDGWHWRSSLSRTDDGQGACELVWVEKVDIQE
jgi:hypothetical protein